MGSGPLRRLEAGRRGGVRGVRKGLREEGAKGAGALSGARVRAPRRLPRPEPPQFAFLTGSREGETRTAPAKPALAPDRPSALGFQSPQARDLPLFLRRGDRWNPPFSPPDVLDVPLRQGHPTRRTEAVRPMDGKQRSDPPPTLLPDPVRGAALPALRERSSPSPSDRPWGAGLGFPRFPIPSERPSDEALKTGRQRHPFRRGSGRTRGRVAWDEPKRRDENPRKRFPARRFRASCAPRWFPGRHPAIRLEYWERPPERRAVPPPGRGGGAWRLRGSEHRFGVWARRSTPRLADAPLPGTGGDPPHLPAGR